MLSNVVQSDPQVPEKTMRVAYKLARNDFQCVRNVWWLDVTWNIRSRRRVDRRSMGRNRQTFLAMLSQNRIVLSSSMMELSRRDWCLSCFVGAHSHTWREIAVQSIIEGKKYERIVILYKFVHVFVPHIGILIVKVLTHCDQDIIWAIHLWHDIHIGKELVHLWNILYKQWKFSMTFDFHLQRVTRPLLQDAKVVHWDSHNFYLKPELLPLRITNGKRW